MMVRWGVERARREGGPSYLESTMEAVHLYEKHGFVVAVEMAMEICIEGNTEMRMYEEVGCVLQPVLGCQSAVDG